MKHKIFAVVTFGLGVVQLLLILLSWLITAALPELPFRSLLGSEGIRWFFGQFTDNLASPLLVWLILLGMAAGTLRLSGLWTALVCPARNQYRQRFALKIVLFELLIFAVILGLLTLMPQAILLGVTGYLYPSSFSQSIIPVLCFTVCCLSVTFGWLSASYRSLTDIFKSLSYGVGSIAPLLVIYVLAAQLFYSFVFVF